MATRYNNVKIKNTIDNSDRKSVIKKVFSTQIIPQVSTTPGDIFILSKIGDRLDRLAYLYYNDASLWWYIAQANNLGKGTWAIKPGTVLRIPGKVDNEFVLINELSIYNEKYR
jgi:nucleoid-associated protein YgaU